MRISTSTLFSEGVTSMNQLQVNLAKTQTQISTGRRIVNPADDPAAAARAVELNQADAANTQLAANRTAATNTMALGESILGSVTTLLQDAKTLAVQAGNATLNPGDLRSIASDLSGRLQELIGLANSTDGAGNFLFSGAQGRVQPFVEAGGSVSYQGDEVQRLIQAAPSRQIASTDNGADIFMRIKNGNGTFQTSPNPANAGSGIISQGRVLDATQYTANRYQVTFNVAAGVTTYDVADVSGGAPVAVLSGQPYASGQAITFNGIQFEVQGAPANGDTFDINPSSNQSMFATLSSLIGSLNAAPAAGDPVATAVFQQGLQQSLGALDQDLNKVLSVRATMGGRLRELDALQSTGEDLGLQYKQTLSRIQDTDYLQAISQLNQQQLNLQAAQQSFAKVSQLSLFDFLR
ncbi:flagellar hook-associated protein FlgL [Ferrigenium sp. UT5]|uniref:flagellar hook-associated protein FlgL n=1 Tax=Ferrigenium sp. UT5 TaxID=3242105 RepID=UPI00354FE131